MDKASGIEEKALSRALRRTQRDWEEEGPLKEWKECMFYTLINHGGSGRKEPVLRPSVNLLLQKQLMGSTGDKLYWTNSYLRALNILQAHVTVMADSHNCEHTNICNRGILVHPCRHYSRSPNRQRDHSPDAQPQCVQTLSGGDKDTKSMETE
ncbi:hypothetical protein JOB18_025443 [Solea senegalensis]|uniref:Uncharacterized protein n=1 Tax=Solea senegalensis TaxID=28829 RepID=A0AAV6QIM0_SOLSE|nr:hypothetical protein JOB18_025443 [Solea senegalensis]